MKSKIKIRRDENTVMVSYVKMTDKHEFRYKMQRKLIQQADCDILAFIDTNTATGPTNKRIGVALEDKGIEFVSFKINNTQKKLLGVITAGLGKKKQERTQKFYIIKIDKDNYTEELFMQALCTYDIAIGFAPKLDMEQLRNEYNEDAHRTFFDKEYYDDFVYDSILYGVFRSTIDVEDNAKELEK